MDYTKEQLDKLPKWAQSEIKRLDGYTKTLEQRINEFAGHSETNTYLRDGMEELPLPNNSHVEFKTGKNNLNRVSVYVQSDGDINVNADSRLGQDVVIIPRAANSFYISFIERK